MRMAIAHSLRVKGLAPIGSLAVAVGASEVDVAQHLAVEEKKGHVTHREGRVSGWLLTEAGRENHEQWLIQERSQLADIGIIEAAYEQFLSFNEPFKQLCSDWQIKGDLTDVADRLASTHLGLGAVTASLAGVLQRMATYPGRFEEAHRRFEAGDTDALARPLSDSYHDIWMELHQDLLLTVGRSRASEDGS